MERPDGPRTPEVRRYLREFLSDPRVLDIPAWRRWLVLNLLILPFRPRRSGEAYAKIWTQEGSPLLVHGRALAAKVQQRLGDGALVELVVSGAIDYDVRPGQGGLVIEVTRAKKVVWQFRHAGAVDAFRLLNRVEGIMPALETSHALAWVAEHAPGMAASDVVVVNLSGRGDKDIFTVAEADGISL